jgi:hypothetical protein
MKKNELRGLAVLVILLVAANVLAFVPPFVHTGVFWVSYLFLMVAILMQIPAEYAAFHDENGTSPKSRLYGFPIARVGAVYLIAQAVISLVCMALGQVLPLWLVVLVDVLLLAAAGVGLIATDAMREEIARQDMKLEADVSTMRALQSKASALPGLCTNPTTAKALTQLNEALRFSDPVSSDATREAEQELGALLDELQQAVTDGDDNAVWDLCKRCKTSLTERNRLCKLGKSNRA